jgi:dynein heavy chain 1, cytosolic
MRMLADDDDDSVATTGPSKGSASQQPAWMRVLHERSKDWLGQLPSVCIFQHGLIRTLTSCPQAFRGLQKQQAVDNRDPLSRLYSREGSIGQKLLSSVRKDLADVIKVCEGQLKQTNHLRTLMSSLTKGEFYIEG